MLAGVCWLKTVFLPALWDPRKETQARYTGIILRCKNQCVSSRKDAIDFAALIVTQVRQIASHKPIAGVRDLNVKGI